MNKLNTIALFIITFFALANYAQSQTLQMELTLSQNAEKIRQAEASFEMEGRSVSNPVKNLKIEGDDLSFATDLMGAEIRFSGKLSDGKLGGTFEVFEKNQKVATGTWNLTRTEKNSSNLDGIWKGAVIAQQIPAQQADSGYDVRVTKPAYTEKHPKVLFDEAHNNFHTASGLYKPFADLITNDGYVIVPNKEKFQAGTLAGFDILVIANAAGPRGNRANPAFTNEECDAVRDWVRAGGSLLFIADHAPMGAAAEVLANRFGVDMSKAYTDDVSSVDKVLGDILFSSENKLLADSPITRGRNSSEKVSRVITFTGQSLKGSADSTPILILPSTAVDVFPQNKISAAGRNQGLTIKFGKGRVVVLGEAGMLTAQIDNEGRTFGMNYPNNDNKQFALNVMHWLSRQLN
jgi:hypothetical protein